MFPRIDAMDRVIHLIGKDGSASLNIAIRHKGFDVDTNFSIYDPDKEKGFAESWPSISFHS